MSLAILGQLTSLDYKRALKLARDPRHKIDVGDLGLSDGRRVLDLAVRDDQNLELVKILLDHGADMHRVAEATGTNALHEAVLIGAPAIAQLLLERGADPAVVCNETTVLMIAIRRKLHVLIPAIAATGLSLDGWRPGGNPYLIEAMELREVDSVLALLACGASLDVSSAGRDAVTIARIIGGEIQQVVEAALAERQMAEVSAKGLQARQIPRVGL